MPTSGPIVRTGTTPEFWKNWDNVFGDKPKKTKSTTKAKKTAKSSTTAKSSAKKSTAKKKKSTAKSTARKK